MVMTRLTKSPEMSCRAFHRPSRMRRPAWLPTSKPDDSMIQLLSKSSAKATWRCVRLLLTRSANWSCGDREVTPMSRRSPGRNACMWMSKRRSPERVAAKGPFPIKMPPPLLWLARRAAVNFLGVGRSTFSPMWRSQKLHSNSEALLHKIVKALRSAGRIRARRAASAKPATRTVRASRSAGNKRKAVPQPSSPRTVTPRKWLSCNVTWCPCQHGGCCVKCKKPRLTACKPPARASTDTAKPKILLQTLPPGHSEAAAAHPLPPGATARTR
mmetsp:Transcript_98683/g.301941  ORF Transcript_98683/g.301941 Transcript_98683/m.301941 type:complete len:271 (+) Transcript_98683:152-964(+)